MKKIVYGIGVLVITMLLYTIPILTVCSFIYDWHNSVQFTLIVTSIIEWMGLSCLISDFGGEES